MTSQIYNRRVLSDLTNIKSISPRKTLIMGKDNAAGHTSNLQEGPNKRLKTNTGSPVRVKTQGISASNIARNASASTNTPQAPKEAYPTLSSPVSLLSPASSATGVGNDSQSTIFTEPDSPGSQRWGSEETRGVSAVPLCDQNMLTVITECHSSRAPFTFSNVQGQNKPDQSPRRELANQDHIIFPQTTQATTIITYFICEHISSSILSCHS